MSYDSRARHIGLPQRNVVFVPQQSGRSTVSYAATFILYEYRAAVVRGSHLKCND